MGFSHEELKQIGIKLGEFYGKAPSPGFAQMFIEEMGKYDDSAVLQGIEHCKRHYERFPALSQIIAVVDSFQDKIRIAAIEADKKKEREDAKKLFSGESARDTYAKNCLTLINGVLHGVITRRTFLDGMKRLDMPTARMEQFYANQGADLNKEAGYGITKHAMEVAHGDAF